MPKVTFVTRDGEEKTVEAPVGLSVMEIAKRNDIDIEAACEGSLACATCHLIIDPDWFERTGEISEDEEDMLDMAFGLKATSRLSCQIRMSDDLDGLRVFVPEEG